MASNTPSLETLGISLPYSIEAEQAVLGSIILNSESYSDISDILEPTHFYSAQNGQIFSLVLDMINAGQKVDLVSLLDRVVTAGVFDNEQNAKVYLFDMAQTVPSVSNIGAYAQIIYDKYLIRSLLSAATEIIDETSATDMSAERLLEFAEQKIDDVRRGRDTSTMRPYHEVVAELLNHLSLISGPDRDKYLGIQTGFKYLDKVLVGLKPSNLIILAARPGFGKTSLALNIAANVADKADKAVAIFSLEMSKRQIAERLTSSQTRISSRVFQTGTEPGDTKTWDTLIKYVPTTKSSNLFIDDSSIVTVPQIKSKARRIKNLGLVVVDYLQLMDSARRIDSRVQAISEITRSFKIMAKELDVPILLLSQLSREGEKEKRAPVLSDLRDSGSIEQDADVVMFLHRPPTESEAPVHEVSLIIAKNRHGETKTIPLNWDGEHTQFSTKDYSDDYREE